MTEKRFKLCFGCNKEKDTLFRCKYLNKNWLFLCEDCLVKVKQEHAKSYCYGGTWKKYKK